MVTYCVLAVKAINREMTEAIIGEMRETDGLLGAKHEMKTRQSSRMLDSAQGKRKGDESRAEQGVGMQFLCDMVYKRNPTSAQCAKETSPALVPEVSMT